MTQSALTAGTKVSHPNFGEGIVRQIHLYSMIIYFSNHGDKECDRDAEIEILDEGTGAGTQITVDDMEMALTAVLEKYADVTLPVEMGYRWKGGSMEIQPKDPEQKPKEVPLDTFFHKIIMVRDRLRVLEQQINSNETLADQDKVKFQQYITKAYGSLTTFNVLFKNKEDTFKS